MRTLARCLLTVLGGVACDPTAAGDAAWPDFMAGCWQADDAPPGSGEHWMVPAGGLMPGMARTLRADGRSSHEFLLIRQDAEHGLVLEALPSGQPAARFALESLSPREVVFGNPAHDFPQRIGYRREPGNRLLGWIEGGGDGQMRRIRFPMHAVPCPRSGTADPHPP
ncbi:MAG: hypothetical protein KF823_00410 [Xanthomonadales bacterium]|nr:hypothetical protein [Xanthomonadales bacterium]